MPHRKKGELHSFFFIRCHHLLSKLAKIRHLVYENQLHHKLKSIGTRYLIGVVIYIMLLDIVWEACFLSRSLRLPLRLLRQEVSRQTNGPLYSQDSREPAGSVSHLNALDVDASRSCHSRDRRQANLWKWGCARSRWREQWTSGRDCNWIKRFRLLVLTGAPETEVDD